MPTEQMLGMMGVFGMVYMLSFVAVGTVIVVSLWRGVRAQEAMARHLESLRELLRQRNTS